MSNSLQLSSGLMLSQVAMQHLEQWGCTQMCLEMYYIFKTLNK